MPKDREEIVRWLDSNIHKFESPAGYLGKEPNIPNTEAKWDSVRLRMVMGMPFAYSVGLSALAVPLVSALVNRESDMLLDRFYFVVNERELELIRKAGTGFFSIDSKRPLRDYDVIGLSFNFEPGYLNMAHILDLSGIPVKAEDRGENDPFVIIGGAVMSNPEPMALFIDAALIGDGERATVEGLRVLAKHKEGLSRLDTLKELCQIPGWYVPQFYKEEYNSDGTIKGRVNLQPGIAPDKIKVRRERDWAQLPTVTHNFINWLGDDMNLGSTFCTTGCRWARCRFCSAGAFYRPYRERPLEQVLQMIDENIKHSGANAFTPMAFNVGDISYKKHLVAEVAKRTCDSLDLSTFRINDFVNDPNWIDIVKKLGRGRATIAVEGASQRVRDICSKGVTEEMILNAFEHMLSHGFISIKVYMMTNIPGERPEDHIELLALMDKIAAMKKKYGVKTKIRWSWTNCTMKPWTPFQWAATTPENRFLTPVLEHMRKLKFRIGLNGMGADIASGQYAFQMLTSGDRRVSEILLETYYKDRTACYNTFQKGFTERFISRLQDRFGIGLDYFTKEKPLDFVFPWDFVDTGISKKWLAKEWQMAKDAIDGSGCSQKCTGCGVCKTKEERDWQKLPDEPYVDPDSIQVIHQRGVVQRPLIRLEVPDEFRWVERSAWKSVIRRSLALAGYSFDTGRVKTTLDALEVMNWVSGVFYAEVCLLEKIFDKQEFLDKINQHLTPLKATGITIRPGNAKSITVMDMGCLFEAELGMSYFRAKELLERFFASAPIPKEELAWVNAHERTIEEKRAWIAKHPSTFRLKQMGEFQVERYVADLRVMVESANVQVREGKVWLRAWLKSSHVGPLDFTSWLTNIRHRNLFDRPLRRLEYYQIDDSLNNDSFLIPRCPECGRNIERNLLGQLYGEKCIACDSKEITL